MHFLETLEIIFEIIFRVVGQHRALVFCQLKAMMDIVENDLFKVVCPQLLSLSKLNL